MFIISHNSYIALIDYALVIGEASISVILAFVSRQILHFPISIKSSKEEAHLWQNALVIDEAHRG